MEESQQQAWTIRTGNEVIKDYIFIDPKDPEKRKQRKQMFSCDLILYRGDPLPENRVYTLRGIRQRKGHFYPAAVRSGRTYWPSGIFSIPLYRALISSLKENAIFQKALALGIVDPIEPAEMHPAYTDMLTGQYTIIPFSQKSRPEKKEPKSV